MIATGETHSVENFLQEAFDYAKLDWKKYVVIDKRYFRPTEVDLLLGDSSKARRVLKWKPKVNFKQLVRMMVDSDMQVVRQTMYGLKGNKVMNFWKDKRVVVTGGGGIFRQGGRRATAGQRLQTYHGAPLGTV